MYKHFLLVFAYILPTLTVARAQSLLPTEPVVNMWRVNAYVKREKSNPNKLICSILAWRGMSVRDDVKQFAGSHIVNAGNDYEYSAWYAQQYIVMDSSVIIADVMTIPIEQPGVPAAILGQVTATTKKKPANVTLTPLSVKILSPVGYKPDGKLFITSGPTMVKLDPKDVLLGTTKDKLHPFYMIIKVIGSYTGVPPQSFGLRFDLVK